MRITNRMAADNSLRNLSGNLERLLQVQDQIGAGKRLLRPSDDPAQVLTAVRTREALAEVDQYLRNVDTGTRVTAAADGALADAASVVQRARELAVQGANGTLGATDRSTIAQEVEQLLAQLVSDASTRVGDQYIFSGYHSDVAPYTVTAPGVASAYAGDAKAVVTRIAPGVTVQTNTPGDVAFGAALAALQQLHAELTAGTPVSGATLTALDAGMNAITDARAVVGARANRLEQAQALLSDQEISVTKLLSNTEDVDMASAISEMSRRQTSYEAALKMTAQIAQKSLLDVLS